MTAPSPKANRDAVARSRERRSDRSNPRACYTVEGDSGLLDWLQRWRGLTDAEIDDPKRVGEELTKMLAEAIANKL